MEKWICTYCGAEALHKRTDNKGKFIYECNRCLDIPDDVKRKKNARKLLTKLRDKREKSGHRKGSHDEANDARIDF